MLSTAFERMEAEHYYFGYERGHVYNILPVVNAPVLDKLVEWKKGDPSPWFARPFKAALLPPNKV